MRSLLLSALLLSLCGCHVEAEHTGNRPRGRRRAPEYDNAPSIDQRLQTRDKQDTSVGGKAVDVYDQVIGAHATTTYHLESCDLLEGVGRPERILFNSPFDALDGGYKPCPRCRPGP